MSSVYFLDEDLVILGFIDDYYSLSWAERYYEAGEFELVVPIKYETSSFIAKNNLVAWPKSDYYMLITSIRLDTNQEEAYVTIRGESVDTLLKRRYILATYDENGNVETIIRNLVYKHLANPTDNNRKIPYLVDTAPPAPTYTDTYINQIEKEPVYDVLTKIAKYTGYGYKFVRSGNKLDLEVYKGVDRSGDQSVIPRVIFSEEFDNVISSGYFDSDDRTINCVYVQTEDPVYPEVIVYKLDIRTAKNATRYESVLETTIDREIIEGVFLTDAEVLDIIKTRGREIIFSNQPKGMLEGEYDIYGNFKYGEHFFLGDIVQTILHGYNTPARVTEVIRTFSVEGANTHVTIDFIDIE